MGVCVAEAPDIVTSSDDYARRFAGRAGAYMLAVQEQAIHEVLDGEARGALLDVGGGHAQTAGPLARHGWDVTVIGSTENCAARLADDRLAHGVKFSTGDILDLPYEDRSFDVALSLRLISHVPEWGKLVAELCRVARRSVVLDYPTRAGVDLFSVFHLKRALEGDTRTYRSFWPKELVTAFAAHGFAPSRERRQFVIPMVAHRMLKGAPRAQEIEEWFRGAGVTRLIGNPVVVRMDRIPS
jgi:SAM-dependent methyltransferase